MAKKSERRPVELNLTPELPQVVSKDFNLFYTPQPEPLPAGVKEFASALENFVKTGGTKAVIGAELEEQKINYAQAEKDSAENQQGFYEKVKDGSIPPTANPYYLEKYKELTLNKYASEFNTKIFQQYGDEGIEKRLEPNSFNNFYKENLAKFLKEKDLASLDVIDLEKGFFKVTSANRKQLEQQHNAKQLAKFTEQFDTKLASNVYGIIDQFKNYEQTDFPEAGSEFNKYKLIADALNAQISGVVGTGVSGTNVSKVVLQGLESYVDNIGTSREEIKFARNIVSQLPKYLQSGTNTYENIGAVKVWQNKLLKRLNKKSDDALKDETSVGKNLAVIEGLNASDEAEALKDGFLKSGKTFTLDEVEKLKKGKSTDYNLGIDNWISNQRFAGGTKDNFASIQNIENALKTYDVANAIERLDDAWQRGQLLPDTYKNYKTIIKSVQLGERTIVLNHLPIQTVLESAEQQAKVAKGGGDSTKMAFMSAHLRTKMRDWETNNKQLPKYRLPNGQLNSSLFLNDAEIFFTQQYKQVQTLSEFNNLFGLGDTLLDKENLSGAIDKAIESKRIENETKNQTQKSKNTKGEIITSKKEKDLKRNEDVQKMWNNFYKDNPNLKPKQ